MPYKIRHENSQLRFPNRAAAERYAAKHGGLDRWTITVATGSEPPAPVVVDDRSAHPPAL
ncbi:MAG: hypothetical protein GEU98_24940 [Pseudonocardiaceae bacterium]|nr:hypothetical protein [Pseudonocardiaceae bacterium]